ncbi:MAG TPA: hypothetical protein VGJ73_21635 [Verrucomicrobiae bacterium]|jgi:hypothetical protein
MQNCPHPVKQRECQHEKANESGAFQDDQTGKRKILPDGKNSGYVREWDEPVNYTNGRKAQKDRNVSREGREGEMISG